MVNLTKDEVEIQQIFKDQFRSSSIGFDPLQEATMNLIRQVVHQQVEALRRTFLSSYIG